MSIIDMPKWVRRKDEIPEEYRDAYRVPPDMMRELDRTLAEDHTPLGTPTPRPRTARIISDEIEHLRNELAGARELVKQGEAKEATLVAELDKTINDELAAKQAAHDADVAELESLRPATGETA